MGSRYLSNRLMSLSTQPPQPRGPRTPSPQRMSPPRSRMSPPRSRMSPPRSRMSPTRSRMSPPRFARNSSFRGSPERRGPKKKNKGRKKRGERPLTPPGGQVHIEKFIRSDVLMQETEGFVIEAPEKMEEEEEEARVKMKDIFKGLKEAKQKEESFKKRQELKELERIIEKKEK